MSDPSSFHQFDTIKDIDPGRNVTISFSGRYYITLKEHIVGLDLTAVFKESASKLDVIFRGWTFASLSLKTTLHSRWCSERYPRMIAVRWNGQYRRCHGMSCAAFLPRVLMIEEPRAIWNFGWISELSLWGPFLNKISKVALPAGAGIHLVGNGQLCCTATFKRSTNTVNFHLAQLFSRLDRSTQGGAALVVVAVACHTRHLSSMPFPSNTARLLRMSSDPNC
ncbi:hypothetical protein K437DRAFT_42717 [Tilletiaria anomala UBC 951]|uniref:Uncharacterized protein n=1 Tax=Tilletiaria anomala (strain ATCC 24038 / CBS 436.72 / UBC 951) TaxID=1037660 RepID=A0A066VEN5_TILAU|nr:uncharacterized protein K437DRAFT_42717 [Tilletiaria anomala UBC 951]KDN37224.1 hypothetical protein K437DRAFT_42717 [Tilletiaria anomala UBC 951]